MSLAPLDLATYDRPALMDAEGIAKAEKAPAVGLQGFDDMVSLGYRAGRAQMADWYGARHLEMVEDAIDRARKVAGVTLRNPHFAPTYSEAERKRRLGMMLRGEDAPDDGFGVRWERFLAEYDGLRGKHPELPDARGFRETLRLDIQKRVRELRAAGVGSTTLGDVGEFIGSAGAEIQHPANIATLPLGAPAILYAPARAGLLGAVARVAGVGAIEGTIAAGTQATIGLEKMERLPLLGVPYGAREYVEEVLGAGAAGFVIGGGLRALVAAWRGVRGTAGAARLDSLSRLDADDAATVAERLILERSTVSNPAAMAEARRAVAAGERVDVGPILQAERTAMETPTFAPRDPPPAGAVPTFTATGRRVDVKYEVTDLRNLIPSHDDAMRPNPAFPADLQPRDRARAASEAQIQEIAGRLEPERLGPSADASTGAPIVGPDNVVESGNGRVLALRRAPEDRRAAYRAWLASQGYNVEGISNPVLIARRVEALSEQERVAFVREANAATAMRMGASEQAAADAAVVGKIVELYQPGEVAAAANQPFLRAFAQALPASERAALVTKAGALSQEGVRRVQGGLLHAAYGDAQLVGKLMESTNNDIKSIGGALVDNAAAWARMRARAKAGEIAPDVDRTADLLGAVRLIERGRAEGTKAADMLAQGALFDSPEATRLFVAMFHADADLSRAASRAAISERLGGYIDEANKTQAGPDLFGAPPPKAEAILLATDKQRVMASVADEAAKARAIVPEISKTAALDVRIADARAKVAAGDFPLVLDSGAVVSARAAMADADAAVRAAKAIEGCAVGAAI